MNTRTGLPTLVLLSVFSAGNALAAGDGTEKSSGRKIVVSASATAHVQPDAARLSFVITTEGGAKAREENQKQVKKVKDALAAVSRRNVDVQVLPLSLDTVTNRPAVVPGGLGGPAGAPGAAPAGGAPLVQSKKAQALFFVTVRDKDPEKLKQMVTRLADVAEENGGTEAATDESTPFVRRARFGAQETTRGPRIEWLAENTREARREAVKKAVGDAMASAQAANGDIVLRVVEINVSDRVYYPTRPSSRYDSGLPASALIPVTVQVQVTYSY